MLLKHHFCHVLVVRSHHQDVLIGKIFEAAAFDQKLWRISDLQVGIPLVIGLRGARYDGAFDDGREAFGKRVEHAFDNGGVTGTRFRMRRRGDGDVGHVDVVDDIAERCAPCRVVNIQVVGVPETVFDRSANHASANDAYLHVRHSVHRWGVGSNFPSFAI